MTYTLDQFCADAHDAMAKDPGNAGRNEIRAYLERLLTNQDFITEHLTAQRTGKALLYHDNDFDFYVMAHGTSEENRKGTPHDHGASWAVYGQAIGITNMTVWNRTDDGSQNGHAEISKDQTFPLNPGNAALFDTGVIHSTAHPGPARWVRVTGTNLDTIARHAYDPDRQFMKLMTPTQG